MVENHAPVYHGAPEIASIGRHGGRSDDLRKLPLADRVLESFAVQQGHVGVLFEDGSYVETLPPGKYAFSPKDYAKVAGCPGQQGRPVCVQWEFFSWRKVFWNRP